MRIPACFMILGGLAFSTPSSAGTVHAILIGDTNDGDIGRGVTKNIERMTGLLRQIEMEGQITVTTKVVQEGSFSCTAILDAVRAVKPKSDDTVVFYYAGHGFRRPDTPSGKSRRETKLQRDELSKFPEFECRRSGSSDRVTLGGIAREIAAPKADGAAAPRLVLAIADACNVFAEEPRPAGRRYRAPASPPDRRPALRRLFLEYSGMLVMSGSPPGDPSWYMDSGGFFTNQFLVVLDSRLRSVDRAVWDEIAVESIKPIFIPRIDPTQQKPQFSALRLHPTTTRVAETVPMPASRR